MNRTRQELTTEMCCDFTVFADKVPMLYLNSVRIEFVWNVSGLVFKPPRRNEMDRPDANLIDTRHCFS